MSINNSPSDEASRVKAYRAAIWSLRLAYMWGLVWLRILFIIRPVEA
jgi:hypothetical protein